MIIFWGRKIIRKQDGIAADFCAICRQASSVSVIQLRSQPHIYYIGIGSGELVGAICQCRTCKTEWLMEAGTVQKTVPSQTQLSVAALIEETFPRLPIIYGERLTQEEAIRRDPFSLDADTRLSLIAEPLYLMDNHLSHYEQQAHSWEKIACAFGCVVCVFLGIMTLVAFIDAPNAILTWLLLIVTAGAVWGTFALNRRGETRFVRETVYPTLATCLSPLKPTSDELSTVLAHSTAKTAKRIVASELMARFGDVLPSISPANGLKMSR